jgi:hypothetical protein
MHPNYSRVKEMTVATGGGGGSGSGRGQAAYSATVEGDRACSALWFIGVKLRRARQESTTSAKKCHPMSKEIVAINLIGSSERLSLE